MQLTELPDDVLVDVIMKVAREYIFVMGNWNSSLVLLSVCRRWRQIAMPVVYGGLYIHHSTHASSQNAADDASATEGSSNDKLYTNIELVSSAAATHLVKYIDIDFKALDSPLNNLNKALDLLSTVSQLWPRVSKVVLELKGRPDSTSRDGAEDPFGYIESISKTVDSFTSLMPAVRSLVITGHSPDFVTGMLYGKLAKAYSVQLNSFESTHMLRSLDDQPFNQLTVLSIDFNNSNSCQMPSVHSERLQSLTLLGISSHDIWLSFRRNVAAREITFSNLKQLTVSYVVGLLNELQEPQIAGVKLQFPALRRLVNRNIYQYCPLMANGEFPPQLDFLETKCSTQVCKMLGRVKFQHIQQINISVLCVDQSPQSVFSALSSTLSKATITHRASPVVISGISAHVPLGTKWPDLTNIQMLATVSTRVALDILLRAPTLRRIVFYDITMDDAPQVVSIPGIEELERNPLLPFDTGIKEIVLMFNKSIYPIKLAVAVVKYMCLRIPSLGRFISWDITSGHLSEFVDEYKELYPHLSNILFDTDNSEMIA
ncbi:hypothetical protein COEREDRAFT_87647 [Coemansia reversa NRRL 1564]|uniref:F-box domain-containing protein n=1 Tax=Coemansia reversa (strain ATCC 12441 / NRRL 1564) TaxID=763665 RepID=A0A2G5BAD2_COERN|nr:hypothetical protein COEREDRAFT_87647 [Coemansia reversa NRRL 1564]|eukprot:PIA15687.1 hypothetical protein COEREDRAFT_87647 [Coemansia reversa NRRL 1564]